MRRFFGVIFTLLLVSTLANSAHASNVFWCDCDSCPENCDEPEPYEPYVYQGPCPWEYTCPTGDYCDCNTQECVAYDIYKTGCSNNADCPKTQFCNFSLEDPPYVRRPDEEKATEDDMTDNAVSISEPEGYCEILPGVDRCDEEEVYTPIYRGCASISNEPNHCLLWVLALLAALALLYPRSNPRQSLKRD